MLGFTAAVAAATCLLFGLAPDRCAPAASGPTGALGRRGASQDRGRAAIQRVLVTAQMALSMVLVIGALLFVRSFHRLITFDPGIRRNGITVAMLGYDREALPRERLSDAQREFVADDEERPGRDRRDDDDPYPADWRELGPRRDGRGPEGGGQFQLDRAGDFRHDGHPLVEGRGLSFDDTRDSARVAVVNQTFARRFTGGASPMGGRSHPPRAGLPRDRLHDRRRVRRHEVRRHRARRRHGLRPRLAVPDVGPWSTVMIRSDLPSAP